MKAVSKRYTSASTSSIELLGGFMAKRKDPPKRVPGQKSLASFVIAKDSRRAETKPASRPENPVALGTRVKIVRSTWCFVYRDGWALY